MLKNTTIILALIFLFYTQINCLAKTTKEKVQHRTGKEHVNIIEVDNPAYFQKNLINNADIYLINTPLILSSGTTIRFSEKSLIKKGPNYPAERQSVLFNINNINDFSIEGGIIDGTGTTDAILVGGGSNNISIKNMAIKNAKRFGIQVYGVGNKVKPHKILISEINTRDCKQGGIYVNSANNIVIEKCYNSGGLRHIGIESPKPVNNKSTLSHDRRFANSIKVSRCISENTTAFGVQMYYADNVRVEDCKIDGSKLIKGDKSCITVDRSNNVILYKDTASNSPLHNIFITGSEDVTVSEGNFSSSNNTSTQIHAIYNIELQEDAVIKENRNLRIEKNLLSGGKTGILINGCLGAFIADNDYMTKGKYDILIMEQNRSKDLLRMNTSDIVIKDRLKPGRILMNNDLKNKVHFE